MKDGLEGDVDSAVEQLQQLAVDASNGEEVPGAAAVEPAADALPSDLLESNQDGKQEQHASAASQLDPALKQALLDSNRDTVLKLEETVQQFIADSSQSSLQFPPSTSNYQRLLEHKVSQHHQLQTTTAFENGQPKVVAKRPSDVTLTPQQKLADIDISAIKIEPKALVKRPPPQQQGQHNSNNQQQQQNNRPKTHKEREADYHEARARIIGSSSSSNLANGSNGNLAGLAGNPASNRPASAGASSGRAALGTGYLAAVPPAVGERGFNIVNPGRGAGRGGLVTPAGVTAPGRGPGANSSGAVQPEPAAAAAGGGGGGGASNARSADGQQQQQRRQQQQQQGRGGPKAIYRDKQRDVQDPDYARGVDRYQQRFDPGYGAGGQQQQQQQQQQGAMYVMPTYGTEFPSLAGAYGAQQQQQQRVNGSRQHVHGGPRQNNPNQSGASTAAANSFNGQQQQGRTGSSAQQQQKGYGQQQQQQQQGYFVQGYGAGYPLGADPAAMYNQYGGSFAPAAYGGYAVPGYHMDPAAAAAAAYGGYGGYSYGAGMQGDVQLGYGGYDGGYAAGGQWQGYDQQQQQHGGRGGKRKQGNGNGSTQQQ